MRHLRVALLRRRCRRIVSHNFDAQISTFIGLG
jgi:hypothetical protein